MDEFVVAANHQVEKDGRMYAPRQVVPLDPKSREDAFLIDSGLVEKVTRKRATTATSTPRDKSTGKEDS